MRTPLKPNHPPEAVKYGNRLVPTLIDERARNDPTKIFASFPRSKDLADGFLDVSYAQLANAINRASWWLSESMSNAETREVFAYLGPNDLRYPILLVAAMKCGYQMMMPSPRNSAEYQQSLFRRAGCHTVFCARNLMAKTASLLDELDVYYTLAPELDELLDSVPVAPFLYDVTFEEVRKTPFMILHTSGSTGPPKPITFTVECVTSEDTHRLLDDPSGRLWWRLFANRRYYSGMPFYHSAGLWFALFLPLWFDSTVVFGPGDRPPTATIVEAVHRMANVVGGIYPPSILEDLSRSQSLHDIKKLDFLAYGGGPLSKSAGDKLSRLTILHNFIGYTEASAPPRYYLDPEDWNYFQFHPAAGFTPEHLHDDIYKAVLTRLPEHESSQTAFKLFPELDEYGPGDILSRHPSKPDLWTYRGRIDDLIVLSTGEKFNPVPAELLLKGCPLIKDSLIIGDGRAHAALLVECDSESAAGLPTEAILETLWPFVQKANAILATQGRLVRSNILLTPANKEFLRSPKGSVQRKATVASFTAEIDHLYSSQAPLTNGIKHYRPAKLELRAINTQERASNGVPSSPTASPVSPRTIKPFPTDNDTLSSVSSLCRSGLPTQENAIAFIRSTLSTTCGIPRINEDDDLFEFGLDSILAMQLSTELRSFSAAWPQDQEPAMKLLYQHPTVRGLAEALCKPAEQEQQQQQQETETLDTPLSDTEGSLLEKAIPHTAKAALTETTAATQTPDVIEQLLQTYTANLAESAPQRPITIALTGSTGSIGSVLLDFLLKHPRVSKVICLNRAQDGEKAQEAANAKNGLEQELPSSTKAVTYFQVDLSQPFLGLKQWQYATMQSEVDVIIHAAWKLDFLLTVKSFERTHIAGVRHLVDFAASSERRPRIVFLSSIATVLGWKEEEDQQVPEEIMFSSAVAGDNGYAHSKYIAERILYEAHKAAGVRTTIVRLGQISGPTKPGAGAWNLSDWVPQIIATSKSLGAVPKSLGAADAVDWVPVDCVPSILMDLIQHDLQAPEPFQVYHATNPKPVSWGSLLPAVCHRLGPDVELVSYQQWLAKLDAEAGRRIGDKGGAFPALRLLGWLRELNVPLGMTLPTLAVTRMAKSSATFSSLTPICGVWMENWMSSWGL